MPVYLIILLTVIITYLLLITSFLLIHVIITGKQQNQVNANIIQTINSHNTLINNLEDRMPITINKQGILQ